MRYAYIHGFGSGPQSKKGLALSAAFLRHGLEFHRPNLSIPTFETMTLTGALQAMDRMAETHPGSRWGLVGSSLGGYLSSLWSQNNPDRVDRLLLLCPAFDFYSRRISEMEPVELDRWEKEGSYPVDDAQGVSRNLHYGFVKDAQSHDERPSVSCPTRILHGLEDEVVPIESSRSYSRDHPHQVELTEVESDHSLHDHLDFIVETALSFLAGIPSERIP